VTYSKKLQGTTMAQ